MKDTIKAKSEYIAKRLYNKITGEQLDVYNIYDGERFIMTCKEISKAEHKDNIDGNECYHIAEVFTTRKGIQYVYAYDSESGEDFIVKVKQFRK